MKLNKPKFWDREISFYSIVLLPFAFIFWVITICRKKFSKMRKWVALNIHNDPQAIYRKIYDALFTRMENSSVPQAIIILSDYTYKSAFVADQEVNMVACMTELMMECKLN